MWSLESGPTILILIDFDTHTRLKTASPMQLLALSYYRPGNGLLQTLYMFTLGNLYLANDSVSV